MDDKAKTLWDNEGGISVKGLIDTLAASYPENASGTSLSNLVCGAYDLKLPTQNWRRAALEAGWAYDPMAHIMHKGTSAYRGFDTPHWQRLCSYLELEPEPSAALDFFVVSDWLADQLIREGEKVRKGFSGMNVWANTHDGPVLNHPVMTDIAITYANKLILEAVGSATPKFEVTARSYAIEIDHDRFIDLMDSESYVTGNAAYQNGAQTLLDKLNKLPGVSDIEHNGHFGNFVYMTISDGDDGDELKAQILEVIDEHLNWCATLEKVDHVVQRRKGP